MICKQCFIKQFFKCRKTFLGKYSMYNQKHKKYILIYYDFELNRFFISHISLTLSVNKITNERRKKKREIQHITYIKIYTNEKKCNENIIR